MYDDFGCMVTMPEQYYEEMERGNRLLDRKNNVDRIRGGSAGQEQKKQKNTQH